MLPVSFPQRSFCLPIFGAASLLDLPSSNALRLQLLLHSILHSSHHQILSLADRLSFPRFTFDRRQISLSSPTLADDLPLHDPFWIYPDLESFSHSLTLAFSRFVPVASRASSTSLCRPPFQSSYRSQHCHTLMSSFDLENVCAHSGYTLTFSGLKSNLQHTDLLQIDHQHSRQIQRHSCSHLSANSNYSTLSNSFPSNPQRFKQDIFPISQDFIQHFLLHHKLFQLFNSSAFLPLPRTTHVSLPCL